MKTRFNIGVAATVLTAVVGMGLTSCKTTQVDKEPPPIPNRFYRTVWVLFDGDFTEEERAAVVAGANMSEGTHRYEVQFAEYKKPGWPIDSTYVQVTWFPVSLQHRIPGHHGTTVNGFYAGEGYNLISINDKFKGDTESLQQIAHHEADHAFGRAHLSKDAKRKLELLRGGNPLPQWQDWTDWPEESSI